MQRRRWGIGRHRPVQQSKPRKARFAPGPLIVEFGSPKGTLIRADLNDDGYRLWSEIAAKCGYYYSALNPESYSKFDRRLFEETLNDWS